MALKKRTKFILQMVYIVATLTLVVILGLADTNFKDIGKHWSEFNLWWLTLGAAAIFAYWLLQTVVYNYTAGFVDAKISFWSMFKITIIMEYYSAITPFATGGQPMQIAYMKRYGISIAKSTSIIAIRFVGFTFSLCAFYILSMLLNGQYYISTQPAIFWLTTVGFIANFIAFSGVLLIMVNRKLVEKIGLFVIRVLSRFKLFKRLENLKDKYLLGVKDFAEAAEYIRKNKLKAVIVFGLSIVSVFCMYSISYIVFKAIGGTQHSLVELMSMQIFLYLAVSFFPTPGALGASEGGFLLFFAPYFGSFVYLATILWRLFTYYSNLIVGGIVIIIDEFSKLRMRRGGKNIEKV